MSLESLQVMKQREERSNATWKRRRDIPLAILAWTGVVALLLWAAGHIIHSLLLLTLAALIAGAELFGIWGALFASPIAGVLQVFLMALWSEWREAHPDQFQHAKEHLASTVAENAAETPLEPEDVSQLLS